MTVIRVSNGKCIRNLSFKTLLASRRRNVIAVIAIALTTLLFTSLFTIVLSINETNQNYQFRGVGSYAHGAFKAVDENQIEKLSAHPKIKAAGRRTVIGICTSGAFEKDYGEVSFMDDNNAKWSFATPDVGRTPQIGREITMDTKALAILGVEPELGADVTLTYTLTDKNQLGREVTDTFTLVGWWEFDELMAVHFFNISEEYAREIEAMAMKEEGMEPFRTDLSVMLSNSLDIENTMTQIGEDCGYSVGDHVGQLRIGVNWGYTATQILDTLDSGSVLAILAVLLIVTFTGYLVIYNIFQISVAGDIRFYGLLKTIGVTPRQLRRIIRQQAMLLCGVGIPVGLFLGYGVGVLAVPIALSTSLLGGKYTTISLSPWIFLGSALFALLTVLLSCERPGRIAGNVSPVEAVRYTEVSGKAKRQRVTRRVSTDSMAFANLGRSKGKTALVLVSLSLAVVLLNLLVTFLSGFDMDKYLNYRSCGDFIVSNPDYFNYRGFTLTEEEILPVKENTQQSLGGFAYGTGLVKMYLPENVWRDEASYYLGEQDLEEYLKSVPRDGDKVAADSQIEGLDEALFSKLKVLAGDLTPLSEPDSHAIAIEVSLDDYGNIAHPENYPAIGEKIKVTYGREETAYDVTYTVCAWVEVPYNMGSRFYSMGYMAVMGSESLRRDAGASNINRMLYLFDTPNEEAEAEAEAYLSKLSASPGSSIRYESKATQRAHFKEFQGTFAVLGGLLCAIIGVVGILNFINAVMTAILSRRREFAVLEAVGQTKRQIKSMLVWEGMLYTLGAGVISFILSAIVNPLAGSLLEKAYWFYTYRYTIWSVLLLLPIFALLGIAIPTIVYRQAAKHSIVEQLRDVD